jgi:hypothetical protein
VTGEADAVAATMFVVIVVPHVTTLPPGLPVPLHWVTRTGIALLTVDPAPTVQATVAPPPLDDPLHWVTVALVVVAGKGRQFTVPPPPAPEPTHWLTVTGVTGSAPGVSALMLFVIVTVQLIGCAASLPEPLHCSTLVTRLAELLVKVPLPGGHGSREHCRVMVTVELVAPLLTVFTTVTVQVIIVVAPPGPGPASLHWLTEVFAAGVTSRGGADVARTKSTDAATASSTTGNMNVSRSRRARPGLRVIGSRPGGQLWLRGRRGSRFIWARSFARLRRVATGARPV